MRRNFLFSSSTTKTGFCNHQSSAAKIIASQFSSIFAFSSSLLSRDTYKNINNKKFNFHQSLLSSSSSSPHLFTQKRFQYGGAPPTDDYYSILGISPSASTSEIKSAYKKLAMQYHPDRNTAAGAEDKFKKVSEAYSVLSNSDKKKQYDAMRSFGRSSSGGMGGMPGMGGGGAGPYANYSQRGPGSSAGAYGGNSSSYSAQYTSRGGPQSQQQQGRAGQSSFVFHNISKEEADQIFSSIFGMGGNNQGKGGGGGGMKSGNLMDDIFGRPGMHPSQASAARQQNQGPQIPPGSVLQSKTTSRNADGTFQRDEVWRLPDGRVMKISHCYDKSGSPPEEGSSERFQQKSGGFGSFAEHVGANFQKQQQQKQQQQQQQPQYDSSGQKVNFPHNPFSQAGGGAEGRPFGSGFPSNPFGSPGSGFGSSSQSGSGGGFNPFEQAYARGPQPGQQSQQYQNPFASAGGSSSFSQSAFNPFSSFMNSGSGSSQGRGGTGGAFAGGSSTQQNPFAQYFGQRSNSPMGGMWFFSPGLRLVAISLLIGFVLASLFSFSIHHPLFFIFLVTMLWVSRARRFF